MAAAGREPDAVRIGMNHWLVRVTADSAEADEFLDKMAKQTDVPAELLRESPSVLVGPVGRIVEQLQAQREEFGISAVHLDAGFAPKDVNVLAPIVAALAGT